jgi:[ribosomal protein S18]-alanine N-acetyltransferase
MIRAATPDDLPLVRELWHAFDEEVPDAPWRDSTAAQDLAEFERTFEDHVVLLADDVGLAVAKKKGSRVGYLGILYVRPQARRRGIAADLVREIAARLRERGADMLELDVLASNDDARAVYERWGFSPVELALAAPIDRLVDRVAAARADGPTFGSIHVQTDDAGAVERAALKTLPRLGRTAGTSVSGPRNGWVAVHDELCDRDPKQLQRLAKEISYTLAAVVLSIGVERGAVVRYTVYDRGSEVDEYLSVPEFYGPLPPGDVIALGANPTVVARLTGADAGRVRAVARTAAAPADLPPAVELVRAIAETMGIAEADHGWVASEG